MSDKFYTEAFGGLVTDYRGDTGKNTYKWNTTDPNNYRAHEIDFSATYQTTELKNAELNGAYAFNDDFVLKAGVSYRGFENSGYNQATDDVNKTAWEKGTLDDRLDGVTKVFSQHHDQSWIIVDWDKALAKYGVTRTLGGAALDLCGRRGHQGGLSAAGLEGRVHGHAPARQHRPARL